MNQIEYFISPEVHEKVTSRLQAWDAKNVIARLWQKDPAVWKERVEEQVEIANRLGWLSLPETSKETLQALEAFASEVKSEFTDVFVLGMGGSSLAPEVFSKTFGSKPGYPRLQIVDSTHPANVQAILDNYDLTKCLFLMASKSGGTAETNSFFYAFSSVLQNKVADPGKHFVALTDPDTSLGKLAAEKGFRKVVITPAEVGGRYSALTPFGALPLALIGVDLVEFFGTAAELQSACKPGHPANENPGAFLGALLGEYALEGKDKVTFFASEKVDSFPMWVEQLVAESSGKEGIGILPVEGEPHVALANYGDDRIFVLLKVSGRDDRWLADLEQLLLDAGKPVIVITLQGTYGLAQEFYRWEFATATACIVLGVNPFDQPNVQSAKTLANQSLKAYKETGKLPVDEVTVSGDGIEVISPATGATVKEVLNTFLANSAAGDYVAVLAFTPYGDATAKAMHELRRVILEKYKLAVTSGYGPRFLHSTGQLHKGGKNNGLFIQIVDTVTPDLAVPGQGYSFGTLITAQAQGDANALRGEGRRLLRLRFTGNTAEGLTALANLLS
jgi:glucose-6-phosphate isomerase